MFCCALSRVVLLQAKDDVDVAEEDGGDKGKTVAKAAATERVYYGPRVKEGEHVFGIAHIYASFNDTFVVRQQTATSRQQPAHSTQHSGRHWARVDGGGWM